MQKRFWAIPFFLLGCATIRPLGNATLVVKPEVGYRSQTSLLPFGAGDINHLTIRLFNTLDQDLGISRDLPNADLGRSIAFSNLKNNTTYRIKAFAYLSTGTGTCISSNDSGSYIDIAVGTDDRPTFTPLKVKLIDKAFNGQGTSSVAVTNGGYLYSASESCAVPYVVSTLAGNGSIGAANGTGTSASFYYPCGVAADGLGNVFVADSWNNLIRKISPNGVVTTIAGNGNTIFADGSGTSATFKGSWGITVDTQGNVFVADTSNQRIRKIDSSGIVTTVAGNGSTGCVDGTGVSATFNSPSGVAVDAAGNLYVADYYNHRIRKITSGGVVTTLAGNGNTAFADGLGTAATFSNPYGVTVDATGNLFVADEGHNRIRKIDPAGNVTTVAGNGNSSFSDGTGTSATFDFPRGVVPDGYGNLYVADQGHHRIRKIAPGGVVTTVTGNGATDPFADGLGTSATFYYPRGIATDGRGNLYVADEYNHRIRRVR